MNKITQNSILLIILLFIFINSINAFGQDKTITKSIKTNNPEKFCLSIKNNSDSVSTISLKWNNKFYSSTNEIKDEIRKLSNNKEDSLFYYAWKFVCNNTYNYKSIVNDNWSTTLSLYINSLGVGLCGKQAIVLSKIWKKLGYDTRIWGLTGHIVPEVYYNNKWHMLDPAFRVYFLNDSNDIANVSELENNPSLITKPKLVLKNDLYYFKRYTKSYSNLLTTKNDNQLVYTEPIPEEINNFLIEIPSKCTFEFPGNFSSKVKTTANTPVPYYANCRLKIPPTWTGVIHNYLILCDIKGNGKINIQNKEYSLNDSSLLNKIFSYPNFIKEMYVGEHTDTIELVYFINPILSEIESENILQIKGNNIDQLKIKDFKLPDSLSILNYLRKQYFFYEKKRVELISTNLKPLSLEIRNKEIKSKEDFLYIINTYFKTDVGLSSEELKTINQKIEKVIIQIPENYNYNLFFKALNNMPRELIFDDMKNSSENQLLYTLLNLSKKDE